MIFIGDAEVGVDAKRRRQGEFTFFSQNCQKLMRVFRPPFGAVSVRGVKFRSIAVSLPCAGECFRRRKGAQIAHKYVFRAENVLECWNMPQICLSLQRKKVVSPVLFSVL